MMEQGDWQPGSRMHRLAILARRGADAADRIEQLEAALQKVMIGGNHLATIIGGTHPQAGTHHAAALEFYGPGHQYDAWCCWNAIMNARAALEERT
jgi:hypothetical protein